MGNRFGRKKKRAMRQIIALQEAALASKDNVIQLLQEECDRANQVVEQVEYVLGRNNIALPPELRRMPRLQRSLQIPKREDCRYMMPDSPRERQMQIRRSVYEMLQFYATHRVECDEARDMVHFEVSVIEEREQSKYRVGYAVSREAAAGNPDEVAERIRRMIVREADAGIEKLKEMLRAKGAG